MCVHLLRGKGERGGGERWEGIWTNGLQWLSGGANACSLFRQPGCIITILSIITTIIIIIVIIIITIIIIKFLILF